MTMLCVEYSKVTFLAHPIQYVYGLSQAGTKSVRQSANSLTVKLEPSKEKKFRVADILG